MKKTPLVALFLAAVAAASWAPPALAQPPRSLPADGWVVLSLDEYRALREKAAPPPRPPLAPAVPAAMSRVEYDLTVDGQSAAGKVRLTADVFTDAWVFVPVPPGLRVRDATLEGRPVALVDERTAGKESRSVLLSGRGRRAIVLDVDVPVASTAGTDSLSLPASAAPVQKTTLVIRAADVALSVTGGLIEQRAPVPAQSATRFIACGRPNEPLVLSWGRRANAAPTARPLRFRGSVTQLVGLGEDSAQVSAQVTVDVVEGTMERVLLRLPANFSVGNVSGPLVADWEAQADGRLAVTFLEPVERSTSVTVTGEARAAREGKLAVPLIRLAGAERETGGTAVEVLGAGEITDHAARGLDPADAIDLSDAIAARRSPALVAFRYRAQPSDAERSLDVTVARYTPQAVLLANVDEARYRVLTTEDGKCLVEARFAVRNSQRSFLGMTLPAGATLWTAFVDGRPVRPGRTGEGALLVPILRDRADSGARSLVHLVFITRGAAWPDEGVLALDLPALDLPVSRTGLVLYHSPRYRLTLEPGVFREGPYAPPETDTLRGTATRAPAQLRASRDEKGGADEARNLADAYQRAAGGHGRSGLLPITVPFFGLGPSRFLAAELTSEGNNLQVRYALKRQVK